MDEQMDKQNQRGRAARIIQGMWRIQQCKHMAQALFERQIYNSDARLRTVGVQTVGIDGDGPMMELLLTRISILERALECQTLRLQKAREIIRAYSYHIPS